MSPKAVNKFKNASGQWLTKALFRENNPEGILTIPDLREAFLESNDLTEYAFATEHLGGWSHWQVLQKAPFIAGHVASWREELEVKIRSQALAGIIKTASGDTRDAFQARKFIVDKGYAEKSEKGRPSKSVIAAKAKEIAIEDRQVAEDYDRLFN